MSGITKPLKDMKITGASDAATKPVAARKPSLVEAKASPAPAKKDDRAGVTQVRRRLSVVSGDPNKRTFKDLDGEGKEADAKDAKRKASIVATTSKRVWTKYHSSSNTGFVPFNPHKVNQDRACEVTNFGKIEDHAVFGVFDGHGSLGHDVSSFVAAELPKYLLKQKNLDKEPLAAISKAFIECNSKLAKGSIDCTFSGTTVIVVYICGTKLFGCNAGDSRAVLGQRQDDGSIKAIPLSNDHKPEREDERKRVIECKGRVEACKGLQGEDIGPARVWLLHQDVPGLAMTRSFGDLIAASVGVIPKPEIMTHDMTDNDCFMILASDGVWEFISSQEAVDIVASAKGKPDLACQLLCEESNKRWREEEEVIDDITAVVVYFKGQDGQPL